MVDIKKISGRYQHASPVETFQTTAGKFAGDLMILAELQGKLMKADAKSAIHQSIAPAVTLVIGCSCLLGCIPVVVFGLASAIAYYLEIETWMAQLAVGGSLATVSILCVVFAGRTLAKPNGLFKRSTEEFSKNMAWTKDVFHGFSNR